MIQTVRELQGDEIIARDGAIGSVDDIYFDDERWAVRYLLVDTGSWLPGKRVLISPASVDGTISNPAVIHVELTRDEVQNAPDERSDLPISRQYEKALAAYFGYPPYWTGPMLWGPTPLPRRRQSPVEAAELEAIRDGKREILDGDPHLRSCAEVIGYGIEARDGSIGEVQDFVVDEDTWAIREVVVDTMKWWPGGHVRVHPEYVERIDWAERRMHLRLRRDEVKRAGAEGPW